jgi:hypothetical protein
MSDEQVFTTLASRDPQWTTADTVEGQGQRMSDAAIPLSLFSRFSESVMESLGELKGDVKAIRDHLGRLNDSVAKTAGRLTDLERHCAERQSGCPAVVDIRTKVHEMEVDIEKRKAALVAKTQTEDEERKRDKSMMEVWVYPTIKIILGVFLAIVLIHYAEVLKIYKP